VFEAVAAHLPGEVDLQMLMADYLVSRRIELGARMLIADSGPSDHPPIPDFKIEIISGFGKGPCAPKPG
jgi:hypothetical protein